MSVNERIKAVFILQKFIRMSRFLLPAYFELIHKPELTKNELNKLSRINNVYKSFKASSSISAELINSNIIDLIKKLYNASLTNTNIDETKIYEAFITESDRLINRWNKQLLN